MSSIFAKTIARAISDYRQFLRKYLTQAERVRKLADLDLKNTKMYENELDLYRLACNIVRDIEQNIEIPEQNYYSYSGIAKFCEYLKEYLNNYEPEGNAVIHKAQKASRALVLAIQLVGLPEHRLTEDIAKKFRQCNEIIANVGSTEQHELYAATLEKQKVVNENFYISILDNFKAHLNSSVTESA